MKLTSIPVYLLYALVLIREIVSKHYTYIMFLAFYVDYLLSGQPDERKQYAEPWLCQSVQHIKLMTHTTRCIFAAISLRFRIALPLYVEPRFAIHD